jgi:glucan phosphorylase/glycosidase
MSLTKIRQPMDTSSTRVRKEKHWWTVPMDVYEMADALEYWGAGDENDPFRRRAGAPQAGAWHAGEVAELLAHQGVRFANAVRNVTLAAGSLGISVTARRMLAGLTAAVEDGATREAVERISRLPYNVRYHLLHSIATDHAALREWNGEAERLDEALRRAAELHGFKASPVRGGRVTDPRYRDYRIVRDGREETVRFVLSDVPSFLQRTGLHALGTIRGPTSGLPAEVALQTAAFELDSPADLTQLTAVIFHEIDELFLILSRVAPDAAHKASLKKLGDEAVRGVMEAVGKRWKDELREQTVGALVRVVGRSGAVSSGFIFHEDAASYYVAAAKHSLWASPGTAGKPRLAEDSVTLELANGESVKGEVLNAGEEVAAYSVDGQGYRPQDVALVRLPKESLAGAAGLSVLPLATGTGVEPGTPVALASAKRGELDRGVFVEVRAIPNTSPAEPQVVAEVTGVPGDSGSPLVRLNPATGRAEALGLLTGPIGDEAAGRLRFVDPRTLRAALERLAAPGEASRPAPTGSWYDGDVAELLGRHVLPSLSHAALSAVTIGFSDAYPQVARALLDSAHVRNTEQMVEQVRNLPQSVRLHLLHQVALRRENLADWGREKGRLESALRLAGVDAEFVESDGDALVYRLTYGKATRPVKFYLSEVPSFLQRADLHALGTVRAPTAGTYAEVALQKPAFTLDAANAAPALLSETVLHVVHELFAAARGENPETARADLRRRRPDGEKRVAAALAERLPKRTWVDQTVPILRDRPVLEVTMEMALPGELLDLLLERIEDEAEFLGAAMATTVGGIGPLLKERIRALADRGADTVGVSLLYNSVWVQVLQPGGEMKQVKIDVGRHLRAVMEDTGRVIDLEMNDGRRVKAKVWKAPAGFGAASVYYLDTQVEGNPADLNRITEVVYPGKPDFGKDEDKVRNQQSWVVGRGALALMKKVEQRPPSTIVLSEAPSIMGMPKLVQDEFHDDPFFQDSQVVFNDHTPLEYAHPLWDIDTLRSLKFDPRYYDAAKMNVWVKKVKDAEGHEHVLPVPPGEVDEGRHKVDLTALIINASDAVYGVAQKHGHVMRMMSPLQFFIAKIRAVTNGVSALYWPTRRILDAIERAVAGTLRAVDVREMLAEKAEHKEKLIALLGRRIHREELDAVLKQGGGFEFTGEGSLLKAGPGLEGFLGGLDRAPARVTAAHLSAGHVDTYLQYLLKGVHEGDAIRAAARRVVADAGSRATEGERAAALRDGLSALAEDLRAHYARLEADWTGNLRSTGRAIVVWTRRVVKYKRLERLADMLETLAADKDGAEYKAFIAKGPLFVVGGRMHPNDDYGLVQYARIQKLVQANPELRRHIVFYTNYNIFEARHLFRGADVSMMLADDGREASATGFQKAQMNGDVIIASNDGAVPESVVFYNGDNLDKANGFNVPYDDKGEPLVDGLRQAVGDLMRLYEDKDAWNRMVVNSLRMTPRVDVVRTAQDALGLFARMTVLKDLRDRSEYNGLVEARKVFDRVPSSAMDRARRQSQNFVWKYRYVADGAAAREVVLLESVNGLPGLLRGFRYVTTLGSVGEWSLLYNAEGGDEGGYLFQHVLSYFQAPEMAPARNYVQRILSGRAMGTMSVQQAKIQMLSAERKLGEVLAAMRDREKELNEARRARDDARALALEDRLSSLTLRVGELQNAIDEAKSVVLQAHHQLMGFVEGFLEARGARAEASAQTPWYRRSLLQVKVMSYGARREGESFVTGRFSNVRRDLKDMKAQGFGTVYLLGVMPFGDLSRRINRGDHDDPVNSLFVVRDEAGRAVSVVRNKWVGDKTREGSLFSITDPMAVNPALGSPEDLQALIAEAHRLGLKVVVDFVPNHLAADTPLLREHLDWFIHRRLTPSEKGLSDLELLDRFPNHFVHYDKNGDRVMVAHGKDPNFDGWTDTVQLDYANPGLRAYMTSVLQHWSRIGVDGIRADMAMMVLREQVRTQWHPKTPEAEFNRLMPEGYEFWREAIAAVKAEKPDFFFMAETYWAKEGYLQELGFDSTYDKHFLDVLRHDSAGELRDYLGRVPVTYLAKLAHFLENHDEDRAARSLALPDGSWGKLKSALALMVTLPGTPFFHDGQLQGKKLFSPGQQVVTPEEPVIDELRSYQFGMLRLAGRNVLRHGDFTLLPTGGTPIVAYARTLGNQRALVAVNFSTDRARTLVALPAEWRERIQRGRYYDVNDLYHEFKPAAARARSTVRAAYRVSGDELLDKGLFVDLDPWDSHVFADFRQVTKAELALGAFTDAVGAFHVGPAVELLGAWARFTVSVATLGTAWAPRLLRALRGFLSDSPGGWRGRLEALSRVPENVQFNLLHRAAAAGRVPFGEAERGRALRALERSGLNGVTVIDSTDEALTVSATGEAGAVRLRIFLSDVPAHYARADVHALATLRGDPKRGTFEIALQKVLFELDASDPGLLDDVLNRHELRELASLASGLSPEAAHRRTVAEHGAALAERAVLSLRRRLAAPALERAVALHRSLPPTTGVVEADVLIPMPVTRESELRNATRRIRADLPDGLVTQLNWERLLAGRSEMVDPAALERALESLQGTVLRGLPYETRERRAAAADHFVALQRAARAEALAAVQSIESGVSDGAEGLSAEARSRVREALADFLVGTVAEAGREEGLLSRAAQAGRAEAAAQSLKDRFEPLAGQLLGVAALAGLTPDAGLLRHLAGVYREAFEQGARRLDSFTTDEFMEKVRTEKVSGLDVGVYHVMGDVREPQNAETVAKLARLAVFHRSALENFAAEVLSDGRSGEEDVRAGLRAELLKRGFSDEEWKAVDRRTFVTSAETALVGGRIDLDAVFEAVQTHFGRQNVGRISVFTAQPSRFREAWRAQVAWVLYLVMPDGLMTEATRNIDEGLKAIQYIRTQA